MLRIIKHICVLVRAALRRRSIFLFIAELYIVSRRQNETFSVQSDFLAANCCCSSRIRASFSFRAVSFSFRAMFFSFRAASFFFRTVSFSFISRLSRLIIDSFVRLMLPAISSFSNISVIIFISPSRSFDDIIYNISITRSYTF